MSTRSSQSANLFSFKRYFINNIDSYHGEYYLKEVVKIVEQKNMAQSAATSRTILAEDAEPSAPPPPDQPYEIIGTAINPTFKPLDDVARIVPKKECLPAMLTCGTVIFDVSCDRDELKLALDYMKLLKELLAQEEPNVPNDGDAGDASEAETKKRYLILISTVMSWASTKPLDPESPELPFVETDFRKRKPHENYQMHYDVENEVIGIARKYRSLIGAIVVTCGVTYGGREDVLFYWFQKAWECEKLLPILGRGGNIIPLINIQDLAQIIYNLLIDFPKKLYILAVEQNVTKQKQIIKPLGRLVGTGMFKCIPPDDAFLIPELDQRIYDLMTLNLPMEPTFITETMAIEWVSEAGFGESVPSLMKQFKKERGLKPFKVVIYGPPIVGKTTLSKLICDSYGLIYISLETVAQDILDDLSWRVKHWQVGETAALGLPTGEEHDVPDADEDEEPEDEEGAQEAARQTLAILNSGRPLTEEEIIGFLRQRLLSREAQNRGWVLDGYPTSLPQCAALFDKGEDQDSEAEDEIPEEERFDEDLELYNNVLKKMLPDLVVSLVASDDFICAKAMRQPEGDARLDEETLLKRLNEFRAGDTRDITPMNFFDEIDIHPLVINVTDPADYGMKITYKNVSLRMGRQCNYAKLKAHIEEREKQETAEIETLRAKEAKALDELEKKMQEDREEKMEYWSELYAVLREEEEAALAAAGEPTRNYLIHHIFPTLTPALLEIAKLRPDDPIDFLAEYLFKLNPTGKMLEPGYNLQAEKMLGKIKLLDDALKDLDIEIEPLIPKEAEVNLAVPKKKINVMSAL